MANRSLYPKVLFFIGDTNPTTDQADAANKYGPGVAFRNATVVPDDSPLEDCDAVAGMAPARYADAFPNADDYDAVSARMRSRDPNSRVMFGGRYEPGYDEMSPEMKAAKLANDRARGAKPASIDQRNAEPLTLDNRTTQSGDRRVAMPSAAGDGWVTQAANGGQPLNATDPKPYDPNTPQPASPPSQPPQQPGQSTPQPGQAPQPSPQPQPSQSAASGDDAAVRAAAAKAAGQS